MKEVIEARLLTHFRDESGSTQVCPYAQMDKAGRLIGGSYPVSAGRLAEFDPTLRFDKWTKLPETGGKRVAAYLQKIPWVELRIRPEVEDADPMTALSEIPRLSEDEYRADLKKPKAPLPRLGEKPEPASFLPADPPKGKRR